MKSSKGKKTVRSTDELTESNVIKKKGILVDVSKVKSKIKKTVRFTDGLTESKVVKKKRKDLKGKNEQAIKVLVTDMPKWRLSKVHTVASGTVQSVLVQETAC